VCGAAPDPENEEPPLSIPDAGERLGEGVHGDRVDALHDLADLTQVGGCK
jgi:hypothetical protein